LDNLKLLQGRWGLPKYRNRGIFYLRRYWLKPWRFNGPRFCLACAWVFSNRACPGLSRRLNTSISFEFDPPPERPAPVRLP
jgi:hypothetical protein